MAVGFWAINPAGFEGPVYSPNFFDRVEIGGYKFPGVCKVKALPNQQIDRQKVPGRDGASIIWRGYIPGPIDIECLIWTPAQWLVLQEVIANIWQKAGKELAGKENITKPGKVNKVSKAKKELAEAEKGIDIANKTAFDIVHPSLQLIGITRVVVLGISLPEEGPVPQSRIVNFKCLEYVPPGDKDKTAATTGSRRKAVVDTGPQVESQRGTIGAHGPAQENAPKAPPSTSEHGPYAVYGPPLPGR